MEVPFLVVANFDYQAQVEGDLSFKKGDRIVVLQLNSSSWWYGRCGVREGVFPNNFVEPISPEKRDALATRAAATTIKQEKEAELKNVEPVPTKPPRKASSDTTAPAPTPLKPPRLNRSQNWSSESSFSNLNILDGSLVLDRKPGNRYRASLHGYFLCKRTFQASEWIVYVAKGVDQHQLQTVEQRSFSVNGDNGSNASCYPSALICRTKPASATDATWQAMIKTTFQLQTFKLELQAGRPELPVLPLSQDEYSQYTQESSVYQLNEPSFRSWLVTQNLIFAANEQIPSFAYRALEVIATNFKYSFPPRHPERRICDSLATASTDCGGLSAIFVSIMRANGIASRCLVGRWLLLPNDPALSKTTNMPLDDVQQQYHVKADFYAPNVGWIPVDPTVALQSVPASFAKESGNFMIQHYDLGVHLDTIYFGQQYVVTLQKPAIWVYGNGTLEGTDSRFQYNVEKV